MTPDVVAFEGEPVALQPEETAYLRDLLRGNVEVQGETALVSRMVGHLRLPTGRTLRIRSPKAPTAAVLAWAAYVDPNLEALRFLEAQVSALGEEGDIAALLGRLFVAILEDAILRHGLLRHYERERIDSAVLRGRIDFARLSRQGANLDRVPCDVWQRAAGTALNRFFVAALDVCHRDPVLRSACEPHLSRVRARVEGIVPGVDTALARGTRPLSRMEQPFATAVALARWLLQDRGLAPGVNARGNGFLVNLEQLFERAVARAILENGITAVPKHPLPYRRSAGLGEEGGSSFEIDVLCTGLPCGPLVVDAKFKKDISSANLHQMIAYCTMTGARRAAFVVPAGGVKDSRTYVIPVADGSTLRIDVLELETQSQSVREWRDAGRALASRITALPAPLVGVQAAAG